MAKKAGRFEIWAMRCEPWLKGGIGEATRYALNKISTNRYYAMNLKLELKAALRPCNIQSPCAVCVDLNRGIVIDIDTLAGHDHRC